MAKGTLALSWGDWGGFYATRGYSWRLCLGWAAVTWLPIELDDLVEGYARADALEAKGQIERQVILALLQERARIV